ncbi:hypothetical protein CbuD7D7780_11700 (plasmid) [Coxiella burnetii]|uniref:hypothetical protein n=1 Tax=Coxiella burnetii TaxID=777 RepID=UPI0005C674B9|nr:hypothetical protein [Coxiella burnetii]OYK79191.1 hypothetical protein CbuD7E6568_11445 [Coxiella burnetii]OYK81230.1 hypothetical protein CbuD7D7780_11700 [Coxiella burnetii]
MEVAFQDKSELARDTQWLKASRFAEVSLSDKLFWEDEEGNRESLFDYAAAQYMAATDEADKKILFVAMEFLLQHGDKPSPAFRASLDWPLLELILKYLDTPTPFSEEMRGQLVEYTSKTKEALSHWYTRFFLNTKIKEERLLDVQQLTQFLCASHLGLLLDQSLAEKVNSGKKAARRSAGSSLYQNLSQIVQQEESGQLVAARTYGTEVELRFRGTALTEREVVPIRFFDGSASLCAVQRDDGELDDEVDENEPEEKTLTH